MSSSKDDAPEKDDESSSLSSEGSRDLAPGSSTELRPQSEAEHPAYVPPELPRPDEAIRDGIGEDDNAIPLWFNLAFGASIVFAIGYSGFYLFSGWSQAGQYEAQVRKADEITEKLRASMPQTNPYRKDATAIAEGQQVFSTICAACHKPDGTGLVGPSLVDPYWKYGHEDSDLYESVANGRPGGMPAWSAQLGSEKIWKALAYLETLPTTSEPGLGAPAPGPASPNPASPDPAAGDS